MFNDSSKYVAKSKLAAAAAMAFLAPGLAAQDAAPTDPKYILQTLKSIKQQRQDAVKSDELKLAAQYRTMASDATQSLAYYEEAVRGTQFIGQSKEAREFQDWKKKSEANFKDQDFRAALSLHLFYLSLTFAHDAGAKVKDQLPDLLSYVQQIQSNMGGLYDQEEFMREPLSNSIFVRWLQVGHYVADTQTWEPVPINIDGIYEKVLLPEFRRTGDAKDIFDYWDQKIEREGEHAAKSGRAFDVDKFEQSTKPQLLWGRAQEYVALKQPNRGITEMLAVIKAYPMHADAADWISQVETLVKASAPAPAPAAEATPAPATQATSPPNPAAVAPPASPETAPPQS